LPPTFYLQTSPELAMKRLLAAGAPSIYSLGPVFRSGEVGPLHNVEFCMLEWYQVGGDYQSAMQLTGELASDLLSLPRHAAMSYREAFRRFADCDPFEETDEGLRNQVAKVSSALADGIGADRDALLDVLLSERVAPRLGEREPTLLFDYPLSQAALSKRSPNDPKCSARFELFVSGIELANGYEELLDADELSRRTAAHARTRQQLGSRELPGSTSLIEAMRMGLPACSGVALGVDRLLMLAVDETSVHSVLPFSISTA
ncbi:MAG: amino acid--tRNA ligase-related protein, partial [Planctomycetota bacterium]